MEFDQSGIPSVKTPAPPPDPPPRTRLDDLYDLAKTRDLTLVELNEAFKLERRL